MRTSDKIDFGKHKGTSYSKLPENYLTWLVMQSPEHEWLLEHYPLCVKCAVMHYGNCMDRPYKIGKYKDRDVSYRWIAINDRQYFRWLKTTKGHEWLE